eukprot:6191948-Pleurochrysis_carterae.AAC.2
MFQRCMDAANGIIVEHCSHEGSPSCDRQIHVQASSTLSMPPAPRLGHHNGDELEPAQLSLAQCAAFASKCALARRYRESITCSKAVLGAGSRLQSACPRAQH